jgi:uncharacterized protein (TIGR04255 family)
MQYKNAPIQEAVFDIRVDQVANSDINAYESYGKANYVEYSKRERRVVMGGVLKLTSDLPPELNSSQAVLGVIFSQPSGNKKIQFRRDGYTFNMLKPYTNWQDFSDLSIKYWEDYRTNVKPNRITRVALRYINRIELPVTEDFDFDDYFNNMPQIPSSLEQKFSKLFLQMQVPCDSLGIYANITQTFDSLVDDNKLSFILDIDVFKEDSIDTSDNLRKYFDKLRNFKNSIFESLITDKTRSIFS